MAGNGPPPKPTSQRARRNKDSAATTILRAEVVEPPELPARYADLEEVAAWWYAWVNSPQAEIFSSTDWAFLRETLPLVKAYFYEEGGLKYAGELRLRVAAYGATPQDRARLRMSYAAADDADRKRPAGESGESRARYGNLRAISNP